MKVVTLKDIPEEHLGEATPIAGWSGGSVWRTRQTVIPKGNSDRVLPPAGIRMIATKF